MLLVNSHKFKMAAASTPCREYNRRAAIIEGLHAGRSPTEIIQFFYIRDELFMMSWQNIVLQNNQAKVPIRQRGRVTRKNALRGPLQVVERIQALISEDPGQSLRKLASIVSVSEPIMCRIATCFSAGRCTGSHESFDPKLARRISICFGPKNSGLEYSLEYS